ncbi:MAG TPA: TorF family putative porin [Croceibacterium sp.]|jgi:uncharacterized protein (TIGR02001 family)
MLTSVRSLTAATLAVGSLFAAVPALADDTPAPAPASAPSPITISGSAAIVSQYRFRGLAQSDNKPAVQGSILVSTTPGFYVGTWGSSASAGNSPINIGGTEIDVYGGYTHALGTSGLKVDVGVYGYLYPGAHLGNYYELYGSLAATMGPATAKVGVNYAPSQRVFNYNFTSPTHENTYVYGELGSSIPGTPLSVHSHLGYTSGGFDWGKQYLDYTVGVSASWKMLTLDASLVGTDLSRSDINAGFACGAAPGCINSFYRMSKPVGVLSLTAAF